MKSLLVYASDQNGEGMKKKTKVSSFGEALYSLGELKVEMLEVYAYRAYAYTPQYSPICMLCK